MTRTTLLLCASLLLQLPSGAASQVTGSDAERDRPVLRAVRATGPISVDGRLDDAAWDAAPTAEDFTQVDPEEGQPVSERTVARVLYDDEAIYVGVRLYDREPVSTRLGRRDMPLSDSDWLGVVIDSYHDHRTGFSFDVNPSGVQRDALKSMGSRGHEQDDLSWDPVWEAEVTVDEEGWTAEYRIPFSQLRFSATDEPVWGIQIERVIGRRREYSIFSWTPKEEQSGIQAYGHLVGLENVEPGHRLEVLPYAVAKAEYVDRAGNPFRDDSEYFPSAGVDLLYRLTSDFALNATINPDFGQVEVDPAVINLTVYETFFEEKRPFFIEGSEIFDFGRNTSGGRLFYSRRIGRRPQMGAPTSAADIPEATTILGAGKVTGKTASGWSVGVIEAATAEETARYLDAGGAEQETVAEPFTNYFVGRVRKDSNEGRTSVGGMLTTTNRHLGTEALRAGLRESAYTGGIDFRHEWANRAWVLRGSAVASRVAGSSEALLSVQRAGNHFFQRPDADHLAVDPDASSLSGYSVGVSVAKQAGRHWTGGLEVAATSPAFEVNDLGFQTRTDRRDVQANIAYRETVPGDFLRFWITSLNARFEHNYDWQRILGIFSLNFHSQTLEFWSLNANAGYFTRALDDRATRGGPLIERPTNWFLAFNFRSDSRKAVVYGLGIDGGRGDYGGWRAGVGGEFSIKTSPRWELTLSPNFNREYTAAQYVGTVSDAPESDTYGAHYLFAPLRQTTAVVETRLNITFTPKLSLQLYAQPFIASGDYEDVGRLTEVQSYEFEPFAGVNGDDFDFNYRSLRGTAVLRWEWRPGSTLYLAWQQQRSDYALGVGDFDFGRDRRALFGASPDNVFVLKMNYWLTP